MIALFFHDIESNILMYNDVNVFNDPEVLNLEARA